MTDVGSLAERILTAIDETEHIARATDAEPLDLYTGWVEYIGPGEEAGYKAAEAHITRHNPATVLRHCDADRKIVQIHTPEQGFSGPMCSRCVGCWSTEEGEDWPCDTLQALAEAYGIEP